MKPRYVKIDGEKMRLYLAARLFPAPHLNEQVVRARIAKRNAWTSTELAHALAVKIGWARKPKPARMRLVAFECAPKSLAPNGKVIGSHYTGAHGMIYRVRSDGSGVRVAGKPRPAVRAGDL